MNTNATSPKDSPSLPHSIITTTTNRKKASTSHGKKQPQRSIATGLTSVAKRPCASSENRNHQTMNKKPSLPEEHKNRFHRIFITAETRKSSILFLTLRNE